MNSKQLQNQGQFDFSQPSRPLSNPLSQPISAPLLEPLNQKGQLTVQKIQLMQESKLSQLGEFLEHNIYKKLLDKVTQHLINAMHRQKILDSHDKFNQEKFVEDLNNSIKNNVDRLDVWINYNIIKREDIIALKKAIIEKQERKRQKCQQIDLLLAKIIEKQKDKKAQQIIDKFNESRKVNYVRFTPNPQIETCKDNIIKKLSRKPDHADIEFQKAEEKIKAYKKKTSEELGVSYANKLDQIKFF